MLTLPDSLRDAFKQPLGPVTTDADTLLAAAASTRDAHGASDASDVSDTTDASDASDTTDASDVSDTSNTSDAPLVAVGDVVTYHLREAGRIPDVAIIDGLTEREAVRAGIGEALAAADQRRIAVENPPAKLTEDLLSALRDALDATDPTIIEVTGEEDLTTLPALVAAPIGSTVVYGQPGEGMVHVAVTPDARAHARELFEAMDGDVDAAYRALGVVPDQ